MGFSSHSLLLILHIFLLAAAITCRDISPGSTLYAYNQNQIWSSSNNVFSLRFIPTTDKAYIAAIAYNADIPIWHAGGANISVGSGASLQFLSSGNLLLTNGSGTTIWESNTSGLGVSAASVEDTGNFVLKNDSMIVWSSFDNPTDTIVPNQNFTVDKILRSGQYSFNLGSSGNLILKWNDYIMYWTLGLNSKFNVSLTSPSLRFQTIGIVSILDLMLSSPVYVVYSRDYAEGNNIFRFLKLDSDGNLRIYSTATGTPTIRWSAVLDQCEVFGYCGNMGICSYTDSNPNCRCPSENFEPIDPKDSRKGCKRKVDISSCPWSLAMLELTHARFLTYPPETNSQIFFSGISACRSNCLQSPTCNASTSLSDGTGRCSLKTTDFMSGYQSPALPSTSFIKVCAPVDPNPAPSGEGKGWIWIIAIVVVVVCGGFVVERAANLGL